MVPTIDGIRNFRTYDYIPFKKEDGTKSIVKTGRITHIDKVNYYADFKDTVNALLPRGYIIPAALDSIVQQLKLMGAKVEQLERKTEFKGEEFIIEKFSKANRKFEGHQMASAEGKFVAKTFTAEKGDYMVDLAQPLANLIFYALEPQSDDGLLTWNFFDHYLNTKGVTTQPVAYPVFKFFSTITTTKKKR